ncbi:putative receptor-like protein kinase [Carex littledalei]|uniref:Putative receptor-like protein kinase n=1 Tax=Carex littledalei TaxID=544730 RepID=A0A833QL88_9POAL|nr:putative receptor-like protein kinase [Carex littledalei]
MSQANFTSDITMYGLAQCMRDLSVEECHTCLNQSMGYFQSCCNTNQGGVVLRYECYMRMEIYPYFESNSEDVLSPPPLSIMSSPPQQSVPDSGIAPSSTEVTGTYNEEKETSTPHLFKLEILRIATNYFSPSNKLGEGGFGSVYKVNFQCSFMDYLLMIP